MAQVVHHVPDGHMNSYTHFKLAVTEENPTIKGYDETRWAELPDTTGTDLSRSLALYAWHGRHHVAHITSLRDRMGW